MIYVRVDGDKIAEDENLPSLWMRVEVAIYYKRNTQRSESR